MRQFEYWLRGVWTLLGFGFKRQTVVVYRHRYVTVSFWPLAAPEDSWFLLV